MRKFRSLIAAFLVVLIQITPGPLGLRPAHATIASVPPASGEEWVTVSSTNGVEIMIRQGHDENGDISPPSVSPDGKVSMPIDTGYVYQNSTTGKKAFVQSETGGIMEVDLTSGSANEFIKNNSSNYPLLNNVVNSPHNKGFVPPLPHSHPDGTPWRQGDILNLTGLPIYASVAGSDPPTGYVIAPGLYSLGSSSPVYYSSSNASTHGPGWFMWAGRLTYGVPSTNPGYTDYYYYNVTAITASTPVEGQKPPTNQNPKEIADNLTGKGFPGNGPLNGEIVGAGAGLGKGGIIGGPGQDSGKGVSGLPGGVKEGDIIKMPGFNGTPGDGAPQTDIPYDPSKDGTGEEDNYPDIPYNPEATGDPYTLDELDFGRRFSDFITDAKSSSIFSLPGTIFGNIPGAGSSTITIQGGQIFGTHTFDFADMAGMWVVLRGIVLTGFGIAAVRVVAIKGGSE